MDSQPSGSVTHWLGRLRTGEEGVAQQELWNRFFGRLAQLARGKLGGTPQRDADEEDVVLSAFNSFFLDARAGRFPDLHDRTGLWPLLVTITARKAVNQVKRQRAKKRTPDAEEFLELERFVGAEPNPALVAEVAEETRRLLDTLNDEVLQTIARRKLEGYTNQEIAVELDVSERTVARKLSRIRDEWKASVGE